jgi:hypothetical protein
VNQLQVYSCSAIGQLTALRSLVLDGCSSLQQLPDTIDQLAALSSLYLDAGSSLGGLLAVLLACDLDHGPEVWHGPNDAADVLLVGGVQAVQPPHHHHSGDWACSWAQLQMVCICSGGG